MCGIFIPDQKSLIISEKCVVTTNFKPLKSTFELLGSTPTCVERMRNGKRRHQNYA